MKINNMTLEEFFKELKKPLPVSVKQDGTRYVKTEDVERRISGLLLPSNYSFMCSAPVLETVGSRSAVILTGELVLFSDDGREICRRRIPGGSEITFLKDDPTRATSDLKSFVASAKSNAFTNAWMAMGLSKADLSFKKNNKGAEPQMQRYSVRLISRFTYSARANMLSAEAEVEGKSVTFKIFKEGIASLAEKRRCTAEEVVKCVCQNYGPQLKCETFDCVGKMSTYNGKPQLQFVRKEE